MKYELFKNKVMIYNKEDKLFIKFYSPNLVRIYKEDRQSKIIEHIDDTSCDVSCIDNGSSVQIISSKIIITVLEDLKFKIEDANRDEILSQIEYTYVSPYVDDSLSKMEGHATLGNEKYSFLYSFKLNNEQSFYGLGDHPGPLNKYGYEYINWNTDDPSAHEDNYKSLYKSFPFIISKTDKHVFGLYLDNYNKSIFNMGVDGKQYFIGATKGAFDLYFIYDKTFKKVVSSFVKLTGYTPLPQKWTLGMHQSRWSYYDEKEVLEIANKYKQLDIPLSAIHLDIDYMIDYAVFTINKDRFPNFESMIETLNESNVNIVTIIDPGTKVLSGYKVYEEGIENNYFATHDGKVYENYVWPGLSVYPAFNKPEVRKWWGELNLELIQKGVSGIWTDMNEPASFKGPLPMDVMFGLEKHEDIHNLYGHYMAQATYEGLLQTGKRPFVITRAAFCGTQKFSTAWTGDNQSLWNHIKLAIPQQCNMSISGLMNIGTDIGGFGGDCTDELMQRWIVLGMFSPLMRNHSAINTKRQEPWTFSKKTIDIYRRAVKFRYSLIPYIYDCFHEHQSSGLPIIRPMVLEYENDENCRNENEQFMYGENMIIAPIVAQGQTNKMVYIPKDKYYDFYTNKLAKTGYSIRKCDKILCPIYVKEGSIIPLKDDSNVMNNEVLRLKLFPGKGIYVHYQDDGESFNYQNGEINIYEFTNNNGILSFRMLKEGYKKYSAIEAEYLGNVTVIEL